MSKFTVFYNNECIKSYEMDEPVVSIGRLPENVISIANMGVSRRHAKIEEDADRQYIVTDLNSLNGTYVNGKRIKKINLYSGDKITIGKYTIVYENPDGAQHAPVDSSTQNDEEDFPMAPKAEPVLNESPVSAPSEENLEAFVEHSFLNEPEVEDQPIIEEQQEEEIMKSTDVAISKETIAQKNISSDAVLIETNKHVVYKLDKAYLTIGSGDNDDIFVSGFMIGEEQVSVEKHDDGYYICANKFMGKFKINGKSAKTHLLQHKDRIEVGSSTFRFMENG